jgi:uncharacterized LabA/DUF88 family protein
MTSVSDYDMDKVAVFVDVQNIYYTVKDKYGSHFDYSVFMKDVTSGRKLVKAIAYAIDRGDQKQIQFQNILRTIGFEVKLKPFIQRRDGSAKGDWDVGISLDMVEYAGKADVLVLASGDGDFTSVVQKLLDENDIRVHVYGVPGLTASSLIQSATSFTPIQGRFLLPVPTTW